MGCRDWIENEVKGLGYQVESHDFLAKFWINDKGESATLDVTNLTIEIPSNSLKDKVLVVGAHYDSRHGMEKQQSRRPIFDWKDVTPGDPEYQYRDTPAANDNGSSVAALLALLHELQGMQFKRTLHVVFWVNEEYPFYRNYWRGGRIEGGINFEADGLGSFYHATKLIREERRNVIGCIALDTMGCYDDGSGYASKDAELYKRVGYRLLFPKEHDYVAFLSNIPSRRFALGMADHFKAGCTVPVHVPRIPLGRKPKSGWSDDWAYWQFDVPSFCLSDTAYIRSQHYHRITDTPEKLNYPVYANVVAGVRQMILRSLDDE